MYKIIEYSDNWRTELSLYLRNTFPTYSNDYIEYCIDHSSDIRPSIIVVNENSEVVGCHLYYCTKAMLYGKEMDTQWGHDTYLDQSYRKFAGVEFLLARKNIPAFGLGLTDVNKKLRKLLKSVFLKGVYNYYTITPYIVFAPFQKLFHERTCIKCNTVLVANKYLFKKVSSATEINIPNEGYWYKNFNDLDFIRDKDFIDKRFFQCKVHKYIVFASHDSYFVVRDSMYRGIPAMLISDFRYNPSIQNSAVIMLKAIRKIAFRSKIGIVYFVCGDKEVDKFFKWRIHYRAPLDFITSYKISPEISFTLSGGDSDAEFLKN